MTAIFRIFRLLTTALPFDAMYEGIASSYRVHIWCEKTRMAGLQAGESRMMIDSVVWAQYINVPDAQTDRQPLAIGPYQMPRQRSASGGKNLLQTIVRLHRQPITDARTH